MSAMTRQQLEKGKEEICYYIRSSMCVAFEYCTDTVQNIMHKTENKSNKTTEVWHEGSKICIGILSQPTTHGSGNQGNFRCFIGTGLSIKPQF